MLPHNVEERGIVFEEPPTHMFEIGRFNNETMAFPPRVTIKDWTSGGSKGYANPKPRRSACAVPVDYPDRRRPSPAGHTTLSRNTEAPRHRITHSHSARTFQIRGSFLQLTSYPHEM